MKFTQGKSLTVIIFINLNTICRYVTRYCKTLKVGRPLYTENTVVKNLVQICILF